jgi:hypothetical protein
MLPKRISVKLFAENHEAVDLADFVPIFHRWIQEHAVEGLLIDVADYKHVVSGPGIILIGHEGDYAYDLFGNRPGLQYTLKRHDHSSLTDILSTAFRRVLIAAQKLESEPELHSLRFTTAETQIRLLDRLHTPNTAETFDTIRGEIAEFLSSLYGGSCDAVLISKDLREPLSIQVQGAEAISVSDLLTRLGTPVA